MLRVILVVLSVMSVAQAAKCPSNLLVKKQGAKTFYSADLMVKYSAKELSKFGCALAAKTMTREQQVKLIESEAKAKIEKL